MATDIQKTWEERIRCAKSIKEEWKTQFKIDMGRAYFEGRQNPGYPENEWLTINKIYTHLLAQLPTLYSVDPYFYISVSKAYTDDAAKIVEMEEMAKTRQNMLNSLKDPIGLKKKARLGIHSAHFAFGVCKIHFVADERDNPLAGQPILDEEGNEVKDPDTGEIMTHPETLPVDERYQIDWIDSDDLLVDEDAGPLEESIKWIAQCIRMTMAEAKEDKRLNKAALKSLERKAQEDEKKQQGLGSKIGRLWNGEKVEKLEKKNPEDRVLVFWEIYDIRKREWLMIAEGAEKPLIDPSSVPKGIHKHPFEFLRFVLREKSFYPIPPVFAGLDPQKEYNLSRSRLLTHRKRFNRKYVLNENAFEDPFEAASKLETGEDGTVIIARTTAGQAVDPIKDAPLDQMNIQEILMLNTDLIETLGSPDSSRGIASADSATEASLIDTRLNIREGDRISTVTDFILGIAKKLDKLVQAHIDEDQAVKINGPEGDGWRMIQKSHYDDINGDFAYSVDVGASQPKLPDIERAQWIAFMSQVVIPMPHVLTAPRFMEKIAKMYHIEDKKMLEELREIGLQILNQQVPAPGPSSAQTGVSQTMGAALGFQGGNVNK